jgi:hypothetical protein
MRAMATRARRRRGERAAVAAALHVDVAQRPLAARHCARAHRAAVRSADERRAARADGVCAQAAGGAERRVAQSRDAVDSARRQAGECAPQQPALASALRLECIVFSRRSACSKTRARPTRARSWCAPRCSSRSASAWRRRPATRRQCRCACACATLRCSSRPCRSRPTASRSCARSTPRSSTRR